MTIVYRLNENMLTYGTFRIFVDNLSGKIKTSTNGLPQGTVLAPILFILKLCWIPIISSEEFIQLQWNGINVVHGKILQRRRTILFGGAYFDLFLRLKQVTPREATPQNWIEGSGCVILHLKGFLTMMNKILMNHSIYVKRGLLNKIISGNFSNHYETGDIRSSIEHTESKSQMEWIR